MEQNDKLKQLRALVGMMLEEERNLEAAEAAAKETAARLRKLAEEDVPELMAELEIKSIKLEDGSEVNIRSEVYASISAENADAAHAWLEAHDAGELIKIKLELAFGKGQLALFEKAMLALGRVKDLAENDVVPSITRGVHPQTLKAFLRERLEKPAPPEEALPLTLFGARPVKVAKIKPARKSPNA